MDQLQPGETAYNVPRASRVKGDLRLDVLQQTVDALVARHEVIRTTYGEVGGTPSQIVNPPSPVTIRFTDLSGLAPDAREVEGDRLLVAASRYAFDLAHDLMLRVDVIKMGPQDHILLLLTHHICSDGWSKSVLFREFSDLYDAFARGEPNPLPPLAIQYADFANWQRNGAAGDLLNKQVSYWKDRLAGAPSLLELPLDRPRPPVRTFAGSHQTLQIPRPLADALRALAQREGATPFMVGMAVFQVLMHRYTQQDDICGRYADRGALPQRAAGNDRLLHQHAGDSHRLLRQPDVPPAAGPRPRGGAGRLRSSGAAVREAGDGAEPGAFALAHAAVPGDVRAAEPAAGGANARGPDHDAGQVRTRQFEVRPDAVDDRARRRHDRLDRVRDRPVRRGHHHPHVRPLPNVGPVDRRESGSRGGFAGDALAGRAPSAPARLQRHQGRFPDASDACPS